MKIFRNLFLILAASTLVFSCIDTDDNTGVATGGDGVNILANLYISNNTNGDITVYDFTAGAGVFERTIFTSSSDAEGIYHDKETDQLVQVSRSQSVLNAYQNISNTEDGNTVNPIFSSGADLDSPRDIAVNGAVFVVSDNENLDGDATTDEGRFFVYIKSETGFTLRNTVTVDFAVWGIEFIGDDLFAVVDKTADIASFSNFASTNTTDATIVPTKRITIAGLTRTHGITYDGDTMVLTDIGDAGSDTDGGFHVINRFSSKFSELNDGDTLISTDQVRVSGNFTRLGNPVSVAFDDNTRTIFIAERLNNGGRVLFFNNVEAGGNLAPSFASDLSGASSLHFENAN